MSYDPEKGDSVGVYTSGADACSGSQFNQLESLGGYPSSTEAGTLQPALLLDGAAAIPEIIIHTVHSNGIPTGTGTITATTDGTTLSYTPPSNTVGTSVTVADEDTKVVEGVDDDFSITVERSGSDTLQGKTEFKLVPVYNNVLGMSDVTSAERTSGEDYYLACAATANNSSQPVTAFKAWVGTLGTQVVSNNVQLGASGAGTITTIGSLSDWPDSGWCHILQSDGITTREIVFYTSRTSTALTIPAAGRGLLGTSAGAGAATDVINAVPGIRIAKEPVGSCTAIQTITDINTAPTAVTWNAGITASTGLSEATLAYENYIGLWIHREIPVGIVPAYPKVTNIIYYQFTVDSVTYTHSLQGYYRVANDAVEQYELFTAIDSVPDPTATPDATSSTLPFSYALVAPGAGTRTYNVLVRKRNKYDLQSQNWYTREVVINAAGEVQSNNISTPEAPTLVNVQDGSVQVISYYPSGNDPSPADTWQIFWADDRDPVVATDTPIEVAMTDSNFLSIGKTLEYVVGAFHKSTDARFLLRAKRSSDSAVSASTSIVSITVDSAFSPPTVRDSRPLGNETFAYPVLQQAFTPITTYISVADNIRYVFNRGNTELWGDTDLIFRVRLDNTSLNNGFWTTYGFKQELISGAPTGTVVGSTEIASWNGTKILYILVDGVRRLKLDVDNGLLSAAALRYNPTRVGLVRGSAQILSAKAHTFLQVFNAFVDEYQTAAQLDTDGTMNTTVPWRQRQIVGDIP